MGISARSCLARANGRFQSLHGGEKREEIEKHLRCGIQVRSLPEYTLDRISSRRYQRDKHCNHAVASV